MALEGRLACLVDHLAYLDLNYLGCSLIRVLQRSKNRGESGQSTKVDSSIVYVPGTWYLRGRNRANAVIFLSSDKVC